jgi:ubiquinone/menaquinone biosynthesis C-methylase UbiE
MAYDTKTIAAQFDRMAVGYEKGLWGRYFRRCYKEISLLACQRLANAKIIVDVGCGTAGLTVALSSLLPGLEIIVGMDISPQMINVASRTIAATNNVSLTFGEATALPFKDSSVDCVMCLNSFHHYQNQSAAVIGIARVLRPGGYFVLLDAFSDNPIRKLWCRVLKFSFEEPYARFHTKRSLSDICAQSNMELVEQKTFLYLALISLWRKGP